MSSMKHQVKLLTLDLSKTHHNSAKKPQAQQAQVDAADDVDESNPRELEEETKQ